MEEYQFILADGLNTETLTINPAGWDKIGLSFLRNTTYWSVLRNLSLPLRFVNKTGGGFDFILHEFNVRGINGNVGVTINRRNPATNDYDLFYQGKIDFKPPKFTIDRDMYIDAPLIDNNKLELLKAREETEFNLFDLVTPDNVTVSGFAADRTIDLPDVPIILQANLSAAISYSSVNLAENASKYGYLDTVLVNTNEIGDAITVDGSSSLIYTNNHTETVRVNAFIRGSYHSYGWIRGYGVAWPTVELTVSYVLNAYNSGGGVLQAKTLVNDSYTLPDSDEMQYNSEDDFPYSPISINVPAGGYLIFQSRTHMTGGSGQYYAVANAVDAVSMLYISEEFIGIGTTTNKCLYTHEVFTRLMQLITSETNTANLFYSEVLGNTGSEFTPYALDGEYSRDAWFSGLMCRNKPDAPLNISLKKAFKTIDSIYNLMLGYDYVNDRFYINKKEKAFDSTYLMFSLGEVTKLKRMPMPDAYFSKIMVGYDFDGDYEDFNGAFEFNLKNEYVTISPVKEEKDLIVPYRADSVGIQLTRNKQYITDSSTDTNGDNDIFLVRVTDATPAIPEFSFVTVGFGGAGNYYNSMLSPRQNMVRWGNILKATLYKVSNAIKFISMSKPSDFEVYSDPTTSIREDSDIAQSELGTALFIPELYTFESELIQSDITTLITNPHGYIAFTYNGVNYEGFVNKIELGDYNKKATFELIAKDTSIDIRTFEDNVLHTFEDGTQKYGE